MATIVIIWPYDHMIITSPPPSLPPDAIDHGALFRTDRLRPRLYFFLGVCDLRVLSFLSSSLSLFSFRGHRLYRSLSNLVLGPRPSRPFSSSYRGHGLERARDKWMGWIPGLFCPSLSITTEARDPPA